jgi:hypothetical protein
MRQERALVRHTRFMDYSEAFPDLAGVLLEDSWVLDIAPSERAVSFQLDVVLTPDHPRHRPPTTGEQHCYLTGWLTVQSSQPVEVRLSGAPPAMDASGEADLGNIDRFDLGADEAWELEGTWGSVRVVRPTVSLRPE